MSDQDGRYVLVRIPAGRSRLQFWRRTSSRTGGATSELRGGEQLRDVDFVLGQSRVLGAREGRSRRAPPVPPCGLRGDGPVRTSRRRNKAATGGSAPQTDAGPAPFAFRQNERTDRCTTGSRATLDAASSPVVRTVLRRGSCMSRVLDASTARPVRGFRLPGRVRGFRNRQDAEDHADGVFVVAVPCARCDVTIAAARYET
jgi:hypothetical protein